MVVGMAAQIGDLWRSISEFPRRQSMEEPLWKKSLLHPLIFAFPMEEPLWKKSLLHLLIFAFPKEMRKPAQESCFLAVKLSLR